MRRAKTEASLVRDAILSVQWKLDRPIHAVLMGALRSDGFVPGAEIGWANVTTRSGSSG